MKTEIICVGTELLVGDIVNTNAQYISAKFIDMQIPPQISLKVSIKPTLQYKKLI